MGRLVVIAAVLCCGVAVASAQAGPPAGGGAGLGEPQTPAAAPQTPAAPRAPTPAMTVAIFDAVVYQIDPVVGQHVTWQMHQTAAAMGYRVLGSAATTRAAQRVRMAYPPSPADLWRATYAAGANRGIFARTWAEQGHYVTEVMVASLDGTGPFFARGASGAADLHATVDRLVRQALPPPTVWDAAGAARWGGRGQAQAPATGAAAPGQVPPPPASTPPGAGAAPGGPAAGQPSQASPPASFYDQTLPGEPPPGQQGEATNKPRHRFEMALQTEAAIGTSGGGFYNHLLGLRLGYRFTETTMLSAYIAYANLAGRNHRVSNVLPYAEIEHRIRVSPNIRMTIPLRFAIGYLPYNGPVIRAAVGLNFPLSDRFELNADLLAPTFWVLKGRTAVSLDLALELAVRL